MWMLTYKFKLLVKLNLSLNKWFYKMDTHVLWLHIQLFVQEILNPWTLLGLEIKSYGLLPSITAPYVILPCTPAVKIHGD